MSDEGSFLIRWSRLKRAAEHAATKAAPQADAVPVAPVDPASLPPLESINAATEVGLFLQAGVPEELTRAALRRAWSADPAIRDFIGIAEYQWDFNAEDSLRGFGALLPSDYKGLLARALGRTEAVAAVENHPPAAAEPVEPPEPPAIAAPTPDAAVARQTQQPPEPAAPAAPVRRSHGSALPQWQDRS